MADTPKTIFQFDPAGPLTGTEIVVGGQAGKEVQIAINNLIAAVLASADPTGTAITALTNHLAAFAHGDIAHANRAALNQVSGINTGDQDVSGLAPKNSPVFAGGITLPNVYQNTDPLKLSYFKASTFTPNLGFIDVPSPIQYSSQVNRHGNYIRIGNFVFFEGYTVVMNKNGAVGDVFIAGLPFNVSAYDGVFVQVGSYALVGNPVLMGTAYGSAIAVHKTNINTPLTDADIDLSGGGIGFFFSGVYSTTDA